MNPYLSGALAAPIIVAAGAGALWCLAHAVNEAQSAWRFARPRRIPAGQTQANVAAIVALADGPVRLRRRLLRRGYVIRVGGIAEYGQSARLGYVIHDGARRIVAEADR